MFHFGSNSSITNPGWYIDDMWVGYIDSTGAGFEDVGVVSINIPDTVYKDTTYSPVAGIYNFGNSEQVVSLICNIGDYVDMDTVVISPDTSLKIGFSEWTPTNSDTAYILTIITITDGDQYPKNDTLRKEVYVRSIPGAIYPPFPNPFRLKTYIKYALPEDGNVRITVYNILGQRIIRIVKREKSGYHIFSWDGRDKNGNKTGQGVYFIRFEFSGHKFTRKLVKIM
jgi:hypothetical protein